MMADTRSISGAKPDGRPSMTQPMAGAWDWPKIVTRSLFPRVFMENAS